MSDLDETAWERFEAEAGHVERAGRALMGGPRYYPVRCPRCLRGINSRHHLQRPFWRSTSGLAVCSSCRRWEQAWLIQDEIEREAIEHAKARHPAKGTKR